MQQSEQLRQRRGGRRPKPKGTQLSEGITVRFDPTTLATLRHLAQGKGMAPGTLIRMWTLEPLKETKEKEGHST